MTSDPSVTTKRRLPFLAAFLSLVINGLGQLYNGQPKRAVLFFSINFLLGLALLTVTPASFTVLGVVFAIAVAAVGWKIAAIVDAFLQARRREVRLAPYNRWYVYLSLVIILGVFDTVLSNYTHRHWQTFSIPSSSNEPTLMPGDYIISFEITSNDVQRGDMILFRLPEDPKITYIKRVIGLPGETIQLKKGQVFINGVPAAQSRIADFKYPQRHGGTINRAQYVETLPEGKEYRILLNEKGLFNNTSPVTLPPGHFYVLGDDRNNSVDSRTQDIVGFVPAWVIYRKAGYVFWSKDWSRIGRPVE